MAGDKVLDLVYGLFFAVCGIGLRVSYGGPRRAGEDRYRYEGRVAQSTIGMAFTLIVAAVMILEAFAILPSDWIPRVVHVFGRVQ